ncbi:transposable element Tc1 transposase [Trichonephila clavipes]|nr:transposable element Tc1 transposase [Trichonephila clavipes]
MSRSDAAIRRCWQEWVNNRRFQSHKGPPRVTVDGKDRFIIRSAVTAPDSLLSIIRMFSDESRFQLCPDDHRRCVWRRPGQRVDLAFTIARHTNPQIGVIVWGVISFDSRTPLVVNRGTLTAKWYVDDILRTVLLPLLLQYPDLIFQQDNAKQHTARVTLNCLTAFQTLSWPGRSSNLSPIAQVWDMRGRQLHLPGNVFELVQQLEQIWQEIPQESTRVLYHSMIRRVAARIQVEVGQHLIELVTC